MIASVVVLAAAGCGGAAGAPRGEAAPTTTAERAGETADPPAGDGPPPVTVRGAGEPVDLDPWTWCWSGPTSGGCADGSPPEDLVDVGATEQVGVSFPEAGWTFSAIFRPAGAECARAQRVDLRADPARATSSPSGGTIAPAGPAGTYDVDVSGRGPGGSDVITTFRWTTTVDGPAPVPAATIDLLEERGGQVEGFGPSLAVEGLAAAPGQAGAHVVVTSSEGASVDLDLDPEVGSCSSEGSAWFYGSPDQAEQAVALGSAPFTYDVALVLDDVEHRARATWPADEVTGPDGSSSTPLLFSPPLPAPPS